ncbi:MAG: chemotaxis protein CheW [Kiritimatiellia bacterium]|nr:chemotaxis protein CheW [Kiritimatiellia bacterium]
MLLLTFKAGENEYALETTRVLRIAPRVKLRSCPDTPAYIAGILNFRSEPVVVVDLSMLINHAPCARLFSTRIIITEYSRANNRQILLGLMAESVAAFMKNDQLDFTENVLKTPGVNYLGKMFRAGDQLIQFVKVEEIVPAELENMLTAPA